MRLMTYNIFNGAVEKEKFEEIIEVIHRINPDILIINEANDFDTNNNARLKDFARLTELPHFHLEECGDGWGYHVVLLSKYPILSVNALKPVLRGIVQAKIEVQNKNYTISALHLSPFKEQDRMTEISLLLPRIVGKDRQIIAGDFNSLSLQDRFTDDQVNAKEQGFKDKFTDNGKPQYQVYNSLINSNVIDAARIHDDYTPTVPTSVGHTSHPPVRLDRIFVSNDLKDNVKTYSVVVSEESSTASDHYPVVIDME